MSIFSPPRLPSLLKSRLPVPRLPRRAKTTKPVEDWAASEVSAALLEYLCGLLKTTGLRYRKRPVRISGGWETSIYRFQLAPATGVPSSFLQPMNLRAYCGPHGVPIARDEVAVLRHMRQLRFPVPRCIHWEESCQQFGGPFLLLEHVPGKTMLDHLLHRPWRGWLWIREMARTQVRLHRLPARDFPKPLESFPDASLNEMAELIALYRLDGLKPGLQWLRDHLPPRGSPRILHLDFHPLNVIRQPNDSITIIDWTGPALGDPHADVATSLLLMTCAPVDSRGRWEEMVIMAGRKVLARLYLRAYQQHVRLDLSKLEYYQAWAAFRRLVYYGRWLHAGPQITGAKPSLITRLQVPHLECLTDCFEKQTGIPVHLKHPTEDT